MFGSDQLYDALNISAITDLLDGFLTGKGLFSDNLIPQSFSGTESINFYMVSPYNGGLNYNDYSYSINCRSNTYSGSRAIAEAVKTGINRVSYSTYYIVLSVLSTIPPQDETDVYNTPIEVTIKSR